MHKLVVFKQYVYLVIIVTLQVVLWRSNLISLIVVLMLSFSPFYGIGPFIFKFDSFSPSIEKSV